MTIQRHLRASSRVQRPLLAAPATLPLLLGLLLLGLGACDSGQTSSPGAEAARAASEPAGSTVPPAAVPAAVAASERAAAAAPAAVVRSEEDSLAARVPALPESHPDHDPHDGHDHSGHAHAEHDANRLAMAKEQAEQAAKAHADAVAGGAPESVLDALAAKYKLAQEALAVAAKEPTSFGTREGSRLVAPIGQERHDFGKLMQGAVASHDFQLESQGTADLVIHQVKPTCGCMVARILVEDEQGAMQEYSYGYPIPPGRKIVVPASLHTKGKRGRQNTSINISSSDPRGSTQLALLADIEPFFEVEPQFLNFGQIEVGETKTLEASIKSARGLPVHLEVASSALPAGTQVELIPVNPDDSGRASLWKASATIGPDLVEGTLARAILIQSDQEIDGADVDPTGSTLKYDLTLTVSARVVGPFTITPTYVSMGLVRPGQAKNFVVRIDCNDTAFDLAGADLRARVVGMPVPGSQEYTDWEYAHLFTATFLPVEGQPNSIDVDLALEGLPESANGSFRGVLLIELGHSDKSDIALPISGVCRGGPR